MSGLCEAWSVQEVVTKWESARNNKMDNCVRRTFLKVPLHGEVKNKQTLEVENQHSVQNAE